MNDHIKPYIPGDEHISEGVWYDILSRGWKTLYHPWGQRGPDFLCMYNGFPFIVEVEQRKTHWETGAFPWETANLPYRRWKNTLKTVLPHLYFSTNTDLSRAIMVDLPFQWEEPEWKERMFRNHGRVEQYSEVGYFEFSVSNFPRKRAIERVGAWYDAFAPEAIGHFPGKGGYVC